MMCILNSRFCKNFLKVSGANNILKGSTFDMMHSEINEIKKRGENMQRKGNRTAAKAISNTVTL
jgi:hypothetical protein